MSQTEIDQALQKKVYRTVAVAFVLLAITGPAHGYPDIAFLCLILAALFALPAWSRPGKPPVIAPMLSSLTLITFMSIASLAAPWLSGGTTAYWSYVVPLIVFFMLPVKQSLFIVAGYTCALVILHQALFTGPEKPQMLISYFFCLLLACAFVFLREQRDKELKPLRKTDNLTLASTLDYLATDLNREIQRSEREGTSLSVLGLGIDPETMPSTQHPRLSDKEQLLRTLGKILHENLRPFDNYYRLHDDQFLIVLPHTPTKQALKKADALRMACKSKLNPHGQNITVSVGVAGLNAGDDAQSLQQNALTALRRAQEKGSNQTRLFISGATEETSSGAPVQQTMEGRP